MLKKTVGFLFGILLSCTAPVLAQDAEAPIQKLLQEHGEIIAKSSRKTIGPAIDALAASGLPEAQDVLLRWQAKEMWQNKESGLLVYGTKSGKELAAFDFASGSEIGVFEAKVFKQMKPNSGIRGLIGGALVQFQLNDPNPEKRSVALDAIERDPDKSHLAALRKVLETESDDVLGERTARLERLLTIQLDDDQAARLSAIQEFEGDLGVDVRAALNPLIETRVEVDEVAPTDPDIAQVLEPGSDQLSVEAAYDLLVDAGLAPAKVPTNQITAVLTANIVDETVAGIPVITLDTDGARLEAYQELALQGIAEPLPTDDEIATAVASYVFYERYVSAPPAVALAAAAALRAIEGKVSLYSAVDLGLDAVSLASIYFLAAIGLAITFGVMGVINMAHGEFIMMGAYTGYVVQLFIPDHTLSLIVALPAAFAVTFTAGVIMERSVIRWLYHRPLETLLATFGISIALQQAAKNIFGTQARPLTAPGWLDGSLLFNDVVSISYIRIAIFVLALLFLALFLFVMNRTRLGLEVRAVTQNPQMAASMGINPDRINMLTFGFGSGIAGITGVAIGLYAKVTSEMGQDYIVQSFMTVVVGGVGNIWGALLGASMVGTLQKGIEWLNPSNTLAAQTYMILFIILFIQFRPRGIIALKGRAAEA
ncbi:MAG: urea ABC transporter permease subunit UrtB [Boseongicola sp.]|nr:urea ABC transporter permease subunit UrtB [Boseongicola sp.]